jgi:hypothetical protein
VLNIWVDRGVLNIWVDRGVSNIWVDRLVAWVKGAESAPLRERAYCGV